MKQAVRFLFASMMSLAFCEGASAECAISEEMKKLDPIGRLNGFFYMTLGEILHRKFEDGQQR